MDVNRACYPNRRFVPLLTPLFVPCVLQIELKSTNKAFGGEIRKYTHTSSYTNTTMTFSVYLPPAAFLGKVPAIYYLSGLTCTDDNAVQKGGAFKACAEAGVMMVFPVRNRSGQRSFPQTPQP